MPRKPGEKFVACKDRFLEELERTGHVYHSCKVAGMSYQLMKHHREGGPKADRDPEFEEQYQNAMASFLETLRKEAIRRAVDGWKERPVVDKEGNVVGEVRKYSDRLLELLLKRHDEGFKERVAVDAKTEHTGTVTHAHSHGVDFEALYKSLTPEEREAWKVVLRAAARQSATDGDEVPPKNEQH